MTVALQTPIAKRLRSIGPRQAFFFAYVVIALLIFIFVMPPFQKPDEPVHFYRAVSITNLDMVCSRNEEGIYGFQMKRKYTDLPDAVRVWQVGLLHETKFNRDWLNVDHLTTPEYDIDVGVHYICNLPPFGYLPNAAGLLLGKPFANPLVAFYLARIAGALFFVAAIIWALRVTPPRYRLLVYGYAALPMVLHQVSAISYDAVQLSLAPLLFAYITRFAVDDRLIKASTLLIFLGVLWWFVQARTLSYLPLLLLIFAIRPDNIALSFRRYAGIGAGFFAFTMATVLLLALIYLPRLGEPYATSDVNASEQVRFVLQNPLAFVEAWYNAFRVLGEGLLKESIGLFGWSDTLMSPFPYYLVVFAMGALMLHLISHEEVLLPPVHIAAILAAVALTVLSIYFSLYAIWTRIGGDVIEGVQGRYLVGLVPLAAFGVAQVAAYMGKRRFLDLMLVLFAVVLLYNLYRAIDLRYYD